MNRRRLLEAAASAALLPLAPRARAADGGALRALFDAFLQEDLQRLPETATTLGLDKGGMAPLKSRLNDRSPAARAAGREALADQLRRLRAIDRRSLTGADGINYDIVERWRADALAVSRFGVGTSEGFSASPYVVSQMTGAYRTTPDFLDTKHVIATAEDAEAYLSRLRALPTALDQNTEQMSTDAAAGMTPPDFLLDLALGQMRAMQVAPEQSVLVASLARRARDKGLGERYGEEAAHLFRSGVLPAMDRQIARTQALRAKAGPHAGVGRARNGQAYYAASLKANITTDMTPDEVHRFGLEQSKDLTARIDTLLVKRGLSQRTVGRRLAALTEDPAYLFADTDAGKAELLAFLNSEVERIRPRLPKVFRTLPADRFEVRRVPRTVEAGAASAYSDRPSLDGKRPGIVWFNLKTTADWPRWALSTTMFHEGVPGHQLETALAGHNPNVPGLLKTASFTAYAEGWGLYAEQLSDEIGIYDDDPLGRIGYLRGQLFRAGRCVVDTGVHHLGWSRQKAAAYLADLVGYSLDAATREIDRYCVMPGQACSYKIGQQVFLRLRARAQAALGARYDIRDVHDLFLANGRMPLGVLENAFGTWLAARQSAAA